MKINDKIEDYFGDEEMMIKMNMVYDTLFLEIANAHKNFKYVRVSLNDIPDETEINRKLIDYGMLIESDTCSLRLVMEEKNGTRVEKILEKMSRVEFDNGYNFPMLKEIKYYVTIGEDKHRLFIEG